MQKISVIFRSLKLRFATIGRLLEFLWANKMWWLIPLVVVLAAFFLMMIFAQSSPLAPFVYTLF